MGYVPSVLNIICISCPVILSIYGLTLLLFGRRTTRSRGIPIVPVDSRPHQAGIPDPAGRVTGPFMSALSAMLVRLTSEPGSEFGVKVAPLIDDLLALIPERDLRLAMFRIFMNQEIGRREHDADEPMVVVGLGSTMVRGYTSANINVQPTRPFRLDRLVIPSDVGRDFLLTDIKVGRESLSESPGCIPACVFTEETCTIPLDGRIAHPQLFITLSVTCQGAGGRNFQGVLLGRPVGSGESTMSEAESRLAAEHAQLMKKRFTGGLTKSESHRLQTIRSLIDVEEERRLGPHFDLIEDVIRADELAAEAAGRSGGSPGREGGGS
jgi:hypothetical protein